MINNLSEGEVIKIWQHLSLDGTELATEDGEPIKIIYPGRINDDRGADFRNAVITTNRGSIKGDIEVHVKSSNWRTHRHHRDPVYNRVILHIVMWNDTEATTNLQNGKNIPILALHKYRRPDLVSTPASSHVACLKVAERLPTGVIAESLDTAGEERFSAKASCFQADLGQMEAGQCLYQGIMGALGYSKNKLSCLELARRVPLKVLESITQGRISDEECLARQQALLLGTAGLLPSQRLYRYQGNELDGGWADKLERLWASSHLTEAMPPDAWHLFKVRPNNYPVRRIAAMSHLLLRCRQEGILETIVNTIKEVAINKSHHRLEKGLQVTTNGYWASHFDFGSGCLLENPTLIGNGRAADIVVNVLLPFTLARSRLDSPPELERKALDLYRSYPRLTVNAVEQHMRNQLGISSRLVNSAQRQQGLIHIYNTLCTEGRCDRCPLGEAT